jgi:hypothetical protein
MNLVSRSMTARGFATRSSYGHRRPSAAIQLLEIVQRNAIRALPLKRRDLGQ